MVKAAKGLEGIPVSDQKLDFMFVLVLACLNQLLQHLGSSAPAHMRPANCYLSHFLQAHLNVTSMSPVLNHFM